MQRLYRFLLLKDSGAARNAVRAIRTRMTILAIQPSMGRPVEGLSAEYREWVIDHGSSGYLALYRHDQAADAVIVLAVRHQREADYDEDPKTAPRS